MESLNPKNPKFSFNTNFQTALPALLANGAAIDNAKVLSSEYSDYLQSCAETANRSLLAALFMMNRLAEVNRQAAAHCRVDLQEVEDTLRDLTAVVSETSPVLMAMAVDLALAGVQNEQKGDS
ncbi:hypothetical protein [Neisseria dentiae]|uniref:hypothetical protein n=1 Tax=Neisseria dentiae TaxID=194197 RepID=UPI00211C465A|nr:hypothetical protein [Neisseria dentiae]MCQ9325599.1 hypothetical protein [Neisseria dentiae]